MTDDEYDLLFAKINASTEYQARLKKENAREAKKAFLSRSNEYQKEYRKRRRELNTPGYIKERIRKSEYAWAVRNGFIVPKKKGLVDNDKVAS